MITLCRERGITLSESLIKHISDICESRGVRLTPQRKRVFELISNQTSASTAYDLLDELKKTEPKAKPPTIYRALEFLLEQGFIHRVESNNSFISCCTCGHDKHFSQLLICDKCGNVVELQDDDQLTTLLTDNANKHGFQITNHVIETHGTCRSCSSNTIE